MRRSAGELAFDIANVLLFLAVSAAFIYPFYQTLVVSFNNAADAARGGLLLWPRRWTLDNYAAVFRTPLIINAYLITVARTALGTTASVLATAMFAYGLSKRRLLFRRFYLAFSTATLFFGGGLIPYFLLVRSLGLVDSFLVYIVPGLISVWNMIIMKSFFHTTPASLEEAAKMDGYNDAQIFFRIVIPISSPIIAAIALFNGVGQWNAWFDAYLFVNNQRLLPLQTILMRIIAQSSAQQEMAKYISGDKASLFRVTPEAFKVATMMIAIGPIILIYPFLQKYFVKGIMIGAIKE
jgi:putative aldouronate transport system permease protein